MKLSVITINLNNKVGLEQTIKSVVNQRFTDYEYIIIDGNSSDGSKELIEKTALEHQIKWISEKDFGIYNAMNKGILLAQGEYLLFINSGDYLIPHVLKKISIFLGSHDIVYGNLIFFDSNVQYEIKYPSIITFNTFYTGSLGHSGGSFIRRDLFAKFGLYNEENVIVSDWEFFIKSIVFGNASTFHINEFISYFDIRGISNEQLDLMFTEREQVFSKILPQKILDDYQSIKDIMKENEILKAKTKKIRSLIKLIYEKIVN